MDRITIRHAITFAALLLGTALPAISHGEPCPPMPRRYTPTMEHQIGDKYHVYGAGEPDLLEGRINDLTRAYHNKHPRQLSDEASSLRVPLVPEPSFLAFFGGATNVPPGHFQNVTKHLHHTSPTLHETCTGKEEYCRWAWGVNPKHNDFNASYFGDERTVGNLRCRPEGVTLIGYVLPGKGAKREHDDYLVTITDLKKHHLPFLKALKSETLDYLKDKFAYDADSDTAQLYFHWPTGLRTSVLHLHAKVNFSMSPTESLRAFTLDEVIHALEFRGENGIVEMIEGRWGAFGAVLLEKSDDDDVRLWSILNGGPVPAEPKAYFKWISDHVKSAWYDPATNKATLQVAMTAGNEMSETALITKPLATPYGEVVTSLPNELRDRMTVDAEDNATPTFYDLMRCLYPAALKLVHPQERDRLYLVKCLRYDRGADKVRWKPLGLTVPPTP
jgi:hypothetical protein